MGRNKSSGSGKSERIISESRRSSRNLSEKRRRNRFNTLVDELAQCCVLTKSVKFLPKQKLEKSAVLESAVRFLKEHQAKQESCPNVHDERISSRFWQTECMNNIDLIQIMQESLDGFCFALDGDGQVMFVSDSISFSLGLATDQFLKSNILDFVHELDRGTVLKYLKTLKQSANLFKSSEQEASRTVNFVCRMRQSHPNTNCFLPVQCFGRYLPCHHPSCHGNGSKGAPMVACLLVFGKVILPCDGRMGFTGAENSTGFQYRLALDWKYVSVDEDAFSVLGFLATDLLGTSAYAYIHPDDLSNVACYHEMLLCMGKLTTCYYRQITKGNSWIWLRATCHISYNQWNSKPETIVCTATTATYSEVCANQQRVLRNDTKRFSKVRSALSNVNLSFHHESGKPGNRETAGGLDSCHSADRSSSMSHLPGKEHTTRDIVTESYSQEQGEICLPDEGLSQGMSQEQRLVFNEILQEQTEKILESIQDKEYQLLLVQNLMHWSQQLLDMYDKFANLST